MRTLPAILLGTTSAFGDFSISSTDQSVRIMSGEVLVTEFRTDSKVPYLYPLSAPQGTNLSRHWPVENDVPEEDRDHPHHRGCWLSHGAVNGYDFWAWTGGKDARIVHRSTENATAAKNRAAFTVVLDWVAEKKTLLEEKRTYAIEDADTDTRMIDVTSTLKAVSGDVLFGDTKEGFFAFRMDRSLRLKGPLAKGGMFDSHGRKDGQCWGKKSSWVAFHGPDDQGKSAVIAMMDHPQNLRHETWWHARDYGLLAANPFGMHDFEAKKDKTIGDHVLKNGESLVFRYRLVLHRGEPDEKRIDSWWKGFSK